MNEQIQEIRYLVGEAWKGEYNSATSYGNANVVQDPTGLSVYRSLKPGNVGHPLTDANWWFCIINLSSIKAESDRIAALNQAIAQDEALRVAAEQLRQQKEAEREAAETQRNEAEQARINAEQQRVTKESQREANEQQRISAEQGRVTAESNRVTAEQSRVQAETLRDNAEEERVLAETNRAAAEQQRIANEQTRETQYAADHTRAEADHEIAVQDNAQMTALVERADADHVQAGEDHTRAESDHTTAASDHTQAGSDHTRAGQDHTQAGSDHTRAESDHTRAESDHAAVEVYVDSLGAFDISAYHATGGVLAKYADLTAALGTNGANIPDTLRKGGMSVKFVLSSDNKYIQARCMAQNFTTDVTQWQGVDDGPIAGSDNLVKSGGVASKLITFDALIHNYYRAAGRGTIHNHIMDYFITEPIFLPNGSKIKIYNTSNNVLPLCKVDKNNVYISTLIDVNSDVREYIATEDMLVSYSSLYVSEVSFPVIEYKYSLPVNLTEIEKKIKNNADDIDYIQEEINDIQEETEDIKDDIVAANGRIDNKVDKSIDLRNILNPEWIHWGGIWQSNVYRPVSNDYGYSDLISCEYPQKLTAYRTLSDGGNVTFAVYNVNKEYLRDVKVDSGRTYITTFEPQVGDAFIRINFIGSSTTNNHANYGDTLNVYTPYNNNPIYGYLNETVYEELDSLNERITDLEDGNKLVKDQYKALFNSVLCIGDSMTAGFRKNLGDLPNYSYPKFMSRMSGWEVENSGNGGQTPRGWWTNKFGLYTYIDYDVAIIYLGQNEGLTDTLETDVDPYSDYHDYADTNTGCYCKIIEGMLEENSNLKIFLLSGTAASDWSTGNGVVINKIAQKYSLPVFNIKTNPWIDLSLDVYHPDISSGTARDIIHYGTIGYLSLGRVIYNYIINYILEHEIEFSSWPYSPQP